MNKNVLLITEGFPFGESEQGFLPTEFEMLAEKFTITILAHKIAAPLTYSVPETVEIAQFEYPRPTIWAVGAALFDRERLCDIYNAFCEKGSLYTRLMRVLDVVSYGVRADSLLKQMREVIQAHNIDIIYTYWCTQATIAALKLKKEFPNIKVITRFHGFDLYNERQKHGRQPLRLFVAKNTDKLVFVCQKGMQYFLKTWPGEWIRRSQIAYLGTNSVQQKKEKFHTDKLVLVSCSNLIPLKRVEMIVSALALLPDTVLVEWHHFGDGISRNELETLAKEVLQNKKNITYCFRGAIPHDKLIDCYYKLQPDLFITTSATEGLPVSLQEVFSMGIPAIGTDVGGMSELIQNDSNGYLLPADVSALDVSKAILRYVALPLEKKGVLGQAAFERWKLQFNAKKNAQKFVDMLCQ